MQFQDDLAAGVVLVRPAFQSPDYVSGSSGWAVMLDGSAEFNDITIRGGTTVGGTALYYNGTPGAGTLLLSIAGAAGTDPYGNTYADGLTVHGANGTVNASTVSTVPQIVWQHSSGSTIDIGVGGGSALASLTPPDVTGVTWQPATLGSTTGSRLGTNTPSLYLTSPYNGASVSQSSITLYGNPQTSNGDVTNEIYMTAARVTIGGTAPLVVGGDISARNLQSGYVSVSFVALSQTTVAVTFPTPFAAGTTPNVVPNIASGAGVTARWQPRAINITNTGFTLFVYKGDAADPAQTWSNVAVGWTAHV